MNAEESQAVELIPIRELSRLTGVNSVTLRAWERRYGLLKPQRTPKGHRLYSEQDIALIQEIQKWLDRGISIGKVKELLFTEIVEPVATDDNWQHMAIRIENAVNTLNSRKLEAVFNELTSTYPARVVWNNIGKPASKKYESQNDSYGSSSKYVFWINSLREKSLAYFRSQGKECERHCSIINPDGSEINTEEYFLGWQLAEAGIRPDFTFHNMDIRELPLVLAHNKPCCIIFYSENALNQQSSKKLLQICELCDVPVYITGAFIKTNSDLESTGNIMAIADPAELVARIQKEVSR